jgi:hypothetical protein
MRGALGRLLYWRDMRTLGLLLLSLIACFPSEPGPVGPSPAELIGRWRLTGVATASEHTPAPLDRLGLDGELLILSGCQSASTECPDSLRGQYRAARPRPVNFPPCDPADVSITGGGDSVFIVLWPTTDFSRRELRGVLVNGQLRGQWAGATPVGWLRGTFVLERTRGSGLTSACNWRRFRSKERQIVRS